MPCHATRFKTHAVKTEILKRPCTTTKQRAIKKKFFCMYILNSDRGFIFFYIIYFDVVLIV